MCRTREHLMRTILNIAKHVGVRLNIQTGPTQVLLPVNSSLTLSRYLLPREIESESPYIFSHFHQHVEPLIVSHRVYISNRSKHQDLLLFLIKPKLFKTRINKNSNHIVIKSSNQCKRWSSSYVTIKADSITSVSNVSRSITALLTACICCRRKFCVVSDHWNFELILVFT